MSFELQTLTVFVRGLGTYNVDITMDWIGQLKLCSRRQINWLPQRPSNSIQQVLGLPSSAISRYDCWDYLRRRRRRQQMTSLKSHWDIVHCTSARQVLCVCNDESESHAAGYRSRSTYLVSSALVNERVRDLPRIFPSGYFPSATNTYYLPNALATLDRL